MQKQPKTVLKPSECNKECAALGSQNFDDIQIPRTFFPDPTLILEKLDPVLIIPAPPPTLDLAWPPVSQTVSENFGVTQMVRDLNPHESPVVDWASFFNGLGAQHDNANPAQWWAAQNQHAQHLSVTSSMTNAQKLAQANYNEDIAPHYICPITQEIMTDPVRDSGSSNATRYERIAIDAWIRQGGKNPLTRERLCTENLVSDTDLAAEINVFVESILHPTFPQV